MLDQEIARFHVVFGDRAILFHLITSDGIWRLMGERIDTFEYVEIAKGRAACQPYATLLGMILS